MQKKDVTKAEWFKGCIWLQYKHVVVYNLLFLGSMLPQYMALYVTFVTCDKKICVSVRWVKTESRFLRQPVNRVARKN